MGATLDGSSAIWCFERSDAIEIRNGIIYTGLPQLCSKSFDIKEVDRTNNLIGHAWVDRDSE